MSKSRISVSIHGDKKLIAELKKRGGDASGAIETALLAAGEIIRDDAAANSPGDNSDIINVVSSKSTKKRPRVDVGPKRERWYLKFVEYGTAPHVVVPDQKRALFISPAVIRASARVGGITARPFLRPAASRKSKAAIDAAGEKIRRAVES